MLTPIITDAGVTPDPGGRYGALLRKLGPYAASSFSDAFAKDYPGVAPDHVGVRVLCAVEPTERMRQILDFGFITERAERTPVGFVVWNGATHA
jgi:hypothetical protein